MTRKGFSLIEVLIVVAIISILVATAVPMYLESQVRTKVAASLHEMNVLAFALETYHIDNQAYVPTSAMLHILTTPVSYLAQVPRDSFPASHLTATTPRGMTKNDWDKVGWFEYLSSPSGTDQASINGAFNHYYQRIPMSGLWDEDFNRGKEIPSPARWVIRSNGPDKLHNKYLAYDPSNGTMSWGDICRFGP